MSNLRVLILNLEKGWRGGENQILLLARYLKHNGDTVTIAYPKNTIGLEKYAKELDTLALDSTSSWSGKNIRLIVDFITQNDIQIIHANSSKSHALALRVKKKVPHVKLVVHRRVATSPKTNFFTRRQYLSPLVDSYVSLSNAISDELAKYGIATEKIVRIPSGVVLDTKPFEKGIYKQQLADKIKVPSTNILLGMACALATEKGVDTFLYFAQQLLKERKDVTFLIAGAGPLEAELKQLAQTLKISDHVHFLGFLSPVTDYLRALDVFLMPTRRTKNFREGLGSVLLEAIMARTSIIASNIDGILDVIIDQQTGHLVNPNQSEEILTTFNSLQANTELQIQKNAIKHVEQDFSAEKMATRNRENYVRLLNN